MLMTMSNNYSSKICMWCDENYYPKDALHMKAENEPAIGRNEAVLNNFPGEL